MKKVVIVLFFVKVLLKSAWCDHLKCNDSEKYASDCPKWAKNGDCSISLEFMKQFCKKSCNICQGKQMSIKIA